MPLIKHSLAALLAFGAVATAAACGSDDATQNTPPSNATSTTGSVAPKSTAAAPTTATRSSAAPASAVSRESVASAIAKDPIIIGALKGSGLNGTKARQAFYLCFGDSVRKTTPADQLKDFVAGRRSLAQLDSSGTEAQVTKDLKRCVTEQLTG